MARESYVLVLRYSYSSYVPIDAGQSLSDDAVMEIKRALRAMIDVSTKTQEQLEAATGIDQGRISKISNPDQTKNRPTLADILRLEEACGVAPGYVLAAAGLVSPAGVKAGAAARSTAVRTHNGLSS